MKLNTLILLIILAILATSVSMYFILENVYVYDTSYVPINVTVGTNIGFNLDTDALNMGTIPPSGSAIRNFTVTNNLANPSKITIVPHGEIDEWIMISQNDFVLEPGERKDIQVQVKPPDGQENGDYKGYLEVRFLKIS